MISKIIDKKPVMLLIIVVFVAGVIGLISLFDGNAVIDNLTSGENSYYVALDKKIENFDTKNWNQTDYNILYQEIKNEKKINESLQNNLFSRLENKYVSHIVNEVTDFYKNGSDLSKFAQLTTEVNKLNIGDNKKYLKEASEIITNYRKTIDYCGSIDRYTYNAPYREVTTKMFDDSLKHYLAKASIDNEFIQKWSDKCLKKLSAHKELDKIFEHPATYSDEYDKMLTCNCTTKYKEFNYYKIKCDSIQNLKK